MDLKRECASLEPARRPTAQQALDRLTALLERLRGQQQEYQHHQLQLRQPEQPPTPSSSPPSSLPLQSQQGAPQQLNMPDPPVLPPLPPPPQPLLPQQGSSGVP